MGCPLSFYTLFFEARSFIKPGADSARLQSPKCPPVPGSQALGLQHTPCLALYVARDPNSSTPPAEPPSAPSAFSSRFPSQCSRLPLPVYLPFEHFSCLSFPPHISALLPSCLQCRELLVTTKHVQCLEANDVQAKHKAETEKPKPTPHPHPQTPTAEIPGCCCPEQLLLICLSSLFSK